MTRLLTLIGWSFCALYSKVRAKGRRFREGLASPGDFRIGATIVEMNRQNTSSVSQRPWLTRSQSCAGALQKQFSV